MHIFRFLISTGRVAYCTLRDSDGFINKTKCETIFYTVQNKQSQCVLLLNLQSAYE